MGNGKVGTGTVGTAGTVGTVGTALGKVGAGAVGVQWVYAQESSGQLPKLLLVDRTFLFGPALRVEPCAQTRV